MLIAKFTQPISHTSNTVDKLNKSKSSGLVNVFHIGATIGMQVVLLPLPLSLEVDNEDLDHCGGSGGGGGLAAATATVMAAVDKDWR